MTGVGPRARRVVLQGADRCCGQFGHAGPADVLSRRSGWCAGRGDQGTPEIRRRAPTSRSRSTLRLPLIVAKAIANADRIAGGGRVSLGLAPGWMREEYAAVCLDFDDPLTTAAAFAVHLECVASRIPSRPHHSSPDQQGPTTMSATHVTPYLTVHNGTAALAFYETAFGAVTGLRVVMDEATGQLGHAEFRIGQAAFYLSDEFPEMGVVSPRTLGGTAVALHLEVTDVDATFAVALDAGASSLAAPADQPHGARHGTLVDPFGHRWMLSQQVETISTSTYANRMREQGAKVTGAATMSAKPQGGIWAALNFQDAQRGIRFMVDVLGFEEELVVTGADPMVVEHSQLRWPEGGIVQAATANRPGNVFSERPIGTESLYVITTDPMAVYRRCIAAACEVIFEPTKPDYDPEGVLFSIRDDEGNIWSFGTYAG